MFNKSKYYPYSTYKPPYSITNCWFLNVYYIYLNYPAFDGLQLSYEYVLDNSSSKHTLQVDVYDPTDLNPNAVTYLDSIPDGYVSTEIVDQLLESEEYLDWCQNEARDDQTVIKDNNQYVLDLNGNEPSHLMANFEYQTRLDLSDSTWNVVGLLPMYKTSREIISDFRTEIRNNDSNERSNPAASIITLQPTSYDNNTLREQRIYTLVNVLGSVGGLFALVAAIRGFLYGVRPVSPYGIVQRYSPQKLKSSIRQALYNNFGFLKRPIPLVHPVDQEIFDNNDSLMQNYHGLTPHSTSLNKDKNWRSTSNSNADNGIEMLPTVAADVQQTVHNGNEATAESRDYTVADNSSRTIPQGRRLEGELDQLKTAFAKQQEMYELLKNDNQMMRRRQQLMEVMLKAYYLDSEVLQELNKAHDINDSLHNKDNVRINMDLLEPPNTTLQSRVRTALQRPFRRRQQRQQNTYGDNSNNRQIASERYLRSSIFDDRITMTDRSSDDNDETPFARDN